MEQSSQAAGDSLKKTTDFREVEAARLVALICSSSGASQVSNILDQTDAEDVQELSTTILKSGHTLLHVLAQRDKLAALRVLLSRGVDVHARNAQGATPLHVALRHNALPAARLLLENGANPSEVVSRQKGTTLLHAMVTCGRPRAVALLLDEKADPNARDREGRAPFHLAAIFGNVAVAAVLLRHEQCDVNAVDATGHTGVMLAMLNNNQELARLLAEAPAVDIVKRRERDGASCLHLAVALGQLDVVRSLLRRNTASINGRERHMGRTPVHLACALCCGRDGTVSSSCVLNDVAGHGETNGEAHSADGGDPLTGVGDLAAEPVDDVLKANIPSVSVVPTDSAPSTSRRDCTYRDSQAAINGHAVTPRMSPAGTPRGRTPRESQPRAKTPLRPFGKASNALIHSSESTPRLKSRAGKGDTSPLRQARHSISGEPLMRTPRSQLGFYLATAVQAKHTPAPTRTHRPSTAPVHVLRQMTPSPQSTTSSRLSYRYNGRDSAASQRARESMVTVVTPHNVGAIRCKLVSLLLDHGADANLMTSFRKSPLHITCLLGAADVMAVLLPHVTNINVLSASNKTALHLAVEGGHTALVGQLLQAGASLTLRDISGMTALHRAASLGHADIAAMLVKGKAAVNSCDFKQRMPLHHACLHRHTAVANLLIKAGACLDRVDDDGCLPLDYLHKHQEAEVAHEDHVTSTGDTEETEVLTTPKDTNDAARSEEATTVTPRRRKLGVAYPIQRNMIPSELEDSQQTNGAMVLCNGDDV